MSRIESKISYSIQSENFEKYFFFSLHLRVTDKTEMKELETELILVKEEKK